MHREKQESALCGTHCLNNLLQGPYFSEIDMAQIAHTLDDRERTLMAEDGTDSNAYLAYMAADSSNVDESGNFSVEVLATCLRNFNLELINLSSPDCSAIRENLLAQTGFICNLQSHWLALRKLGGRWWNLNSLQADNDGQRFVLRCRRGCIDSVLVLTQALSLRPLLALLQVGVQHSSVTPT